MLPCMPSFRFLKFSCFVFIVVFLTHYGEYHNRVAVNKLLKKISGGIEVGEPRMLYNRRLLDLGVNYRLINDFIFLLLFTGKHFDC